MRKIDKWICTCQTYIIKRTLTWIYTGRMRSSNDKFHQKKQHHTYLLLSLKHINTFPMPTYRCTHTSTWPYSELIKTILCTAAGYYINLRISACTLFFFPSSYKLFPQCWRFCVQLKKSVKTGKNAQKRKAFWGFKVIFYSWK